MKLVYLDTSNFSLLAETQQKSPERLKSFLKMWWEQKCVLALSEANIFEVARNGFNESRYNLLKEFRPIRFESRVFPKEIIKAIKSKGIYDFLIRDYDFCRPMFFEVIRAKERLRYLCDSTKNDYQFLANRSQILNEIIWEMKENHPLPKDNKKNRFRDLPELASDEQKQYLDEIILFLERDGIKHPAIDHVRSLRSRLEKVGLQQAFAELAGVNISQESGLNKSFDNFTNRILFENSVKFNLSRIFYNDEKYIVSIVNKISIENLPGEWLRRKVEYILHKSGDFKANNELDIKHISHLPYVDILITDKRIVEATAQVFRSKELLPSLRNTTLPKKVSNSMDSLEKALFE